MWVRKKGYLSSDFNKFYIQHKYVCIIGTTWLVRPIIIIFSTKISNQIHRSYYVVYNTTLVHISKNETCTGVVNSLANISPIDSIQKKIFSKYSFWKPSFKYYDSSKKAIRFYALINQFPTRPKTVCVL